MVGRIRNFFAEEEGAITVDYVVLTAGAVWLGVTVIQNAGNGVATLADALSQEVQRPAVNVVFVNESDDADDGADPDG
ncbi:MAG: hypothetical protein AAGF53_08360 [Pseudomonadota bacterium]